MVRRALTALIGVAVLGYGGAIAYLRLNETNLVYHPHPRDGSSVMSLPDSVHLASTGIALTSADGTRLAGIAIPPGDSAAQWVLYFHGDWHTVTSDVLPLFYQRLHALGLGVVAIDYRGYGNSESRTPSETGLYADARAAYDWLHDTQHVPADRILIYGHSLGSGPAIELASRVQAAGLVVEGAFTSVADLGSEIYPWLPVRLVATQRYDNLAKIGHVAMPKLLLHAIDDASVPYAHGQRLFAAASAPKQWGELKGGHTRAFLVDSAHFWGHVNDFAKRLRNDLPAGESSAPLPPAR
jgi:fermentation-respiration switch protein FrsA (DUF1100 family)